MIFNYIAKDDDLFGTDLLRQSDSTLPVAFRPTIEHVNRQSANKLNNNQTVTVEVPVVRTVEGQHISTDSWKATFKFSALQHVLDDNAANQAIDVLLAYIAANRASIIEGRKPISTAGLTVGS